MPVPSLPYSFGPGTLISSAQVDANFVTIYNWINGGVDNANVGTAGFYASQIKPINPTAATFGGSLAYTFPAGLNAGGPLTATTAAYSGTTTNSNATTAFNSSAAPGVAALQWIGGTLGAVNNLKTNNAAAVAGIAGQTAILYNGAANANVVAIDVLGNIGLAGGVYATGVVAGSFGVLSGLAGQALWVPPSVSQPIQFGNAANTAINALFPDAGGMQTRGALVPGIGGAAAGTAGMYSGSGVPAHSAPNGSIYLRYDGAGGARLYVNTSGANTSGTTWTAVA